MPSNTYIAATNAIDRRQVGRNWWRNVINDLIESERQDMRELRELRDRTRDLDVMRLLTVLYDRKIERVFELTQLSDYKDTDSSEVETP